MKVYKYLKAFYKWEINKLVSIHKRLKYFNIFMLFLSGLMFLNSGLGNIDLPDFARYSIWDVWIWTTVLYSLALVQFLTIVHCDCISSYRWSNTILMLSGFVLLIVGCLFGFEYPPYNWQMTVYPFVGFLFSLAGRQLNKVNLTKGKDNGKSY